MQTSSYGWILFLIGIFISTFIGGAVRAFLSPNQITNWIERKIIEKQPKFILGLDNVEFKLSEGFSPRFGFQASNLKMSSKDNCQSNSELLVESVYFPIKISSLFQGQIKFSDIVFKNSKIEYREPICNSEQEFQISILSPLDSFKLFMNRRFIKELQNSRQWFDSLSFDLLIVQLDVEGVQNYTFHNLFLNLTQFERKLILTGEWQPNLSLKNLELWKSMPFQIFVTENLIELNSQGKLREGELLIEGSMEPESGDYEINAKSEYLPFQELLKLTSAMIQTPENINSNLSWITCKLNLKGNIYDFKSSLLEGEECGLKGDTGSIDFGKIKIHPFSFSEDQRLEILVNKFSGLHILDWLKPRFRFEVFENILNPGLISGTLLFAKGAWNFNGFIQDFEYVFENNNKKRIQIVHNLPLELNVENHRFSGQIYDLDLDGGNFVGKVSFNFDTALESGMIVTSIKQLKFNKYVNQLYHRFDYSPFELYSQIRFKKLRLDEFQGVLGISNLSNQELKMEKLKADLKFIAPKWDVRIRSEKIELPPNRWVSNQLSQLSLAEPYKGQTSLSNLRFSLIKDSHSIEIHNLLTNDVTNQQSIWAELKIENEKLNGALKISTKNSKLFSWDIIGNLDSIEFIPTLTLLNSIKPQHSLVNINKDLTYKERKEVLNKILMSRGESSHKSFSDKLKEFAKSWLSF